MGSKISKDIQHRLIAIEGEMNSIVLERREVIHGLLVALVGQLHVLLLGPGGTAKSMLARNLVAHIVDSIYFEKQLNEDSDPADVFGGLDIKTLSETGHQRVVVEGMLPEATHVLLDEVMNANGVTKRSLQAAMNERLFHNGREVLNIPLRSMVGATNVNNADTDPRLAPFFDRWHIRYQVTYLRQRDNQRDMVTAGIGRLARVGRGTKTTVDGPGLTVTLAELDRAHAESLELDVPDDILEMALDIREELGSNGIVVSDRRVVDGFAAVLANAWLRGHESVEAADLDILAPMWWSLQEHEATARGIVLAAANPSEKAAIELLDELDKIKAEMAAAEELDSAHQQRVGVSVQRDLLQLLREANEHKAEAAKTGADTHRIDDLIARATEFDAKVKKDVFGIDPSNLVARV